MTEIIDLNSTNQEEINNTIKESSDSVTEIHINNCTFSQLPSLSKFTNLQSLELIGNRLLTLPTELRLLPLTSLDVSNNFIEKSVDLEQLSSLKKLHINSNLIEYLKLPSSLEFINLSNNIIKQFHYQNNSLEKIICEDIEHITISSPKLHTLHCSTFDINLNRHHIAHLYINYCVDEITIPFNSFTCLKTLSLTHCELKQLPDIGKLELLDLDLSCNLFTSFPSNLPNSLTNLNLNYNQLTSIPIQQLKNIKTLSLSGNDISQEELKKIPKDIQVQMYMNDDIVEIYKNIYIGNKQHAGNKLLLDKYNIKSILTIANIKPSFPSFFTYKMIDIEDHPNSQLIEFFDECFDFIEEQRNEGPVLIHCMAGISRSGTICISYIMKKMLIPFEEALQFVKSKKPAIEPNSGFVQQLIDYEQDLFYYSTFEYPSEIKRSNCILL